MTPSSQCEVRAGSPPGPNRRVVHTLRGARAVVFPFAAVVVVTCLLLQRCTQHKAKSQAICTQAGQKKNDCRHPVPVWHGPNKRFADAAQAGLGLQCAKSRLSVSLIAAAISPGWSFPEPCSPRPPRQIFFFAAKLVFAMHMFPPRPAGPGQAEEGKGGKSADATFIALLFPASVPLLSPRPAQPMAACVQGARPSSTGRDR